MFEPFEKTGIRSEDDKAFLQAAAALCEGTGPTPVLRNARISNLIALLNWYLEDVSWVGVYYHDAGQLVVGPFQGLPACERIVMGKGVCGAVASSLRPLAVPDVHAFPGHIACDSESRSEVVCPILDEDGILFGVLDIDSPVLGRFSDDDIPFLMEVANLLY